MHRFLTRTAAPAGRNRPVALGLCVALIMAVTGVLSTPVGAAPAAWITGGAEPLSYTEQSGDVLNIGADITVSDGESYGGGYVEYATHDLQASETMWLQASQAPDETNGAVSVVAGTVYLGNGTSADQIGSIDAVKDGLEGRPLRVNFISDFTNSSFESGNMAGWTPIESRIDLGVTSIAGFPTVDTSTYPAASRGDDDAAPDNPGTYTVATSTASANHGAYSLLLESSGMTTAFDCDVVHGPAAYSSTFEAAQDDVIYFDWRAFAGSDAFHVFGYIVDDQGHQTAVLDAYTNDENGSSPWVTTGATIPASGTYRFVFVAGTFDASCARGAGASLHIDNVRVYGSKVTEEVLTDLSRTLMYQNVGKNPPATVSLDVTASSPQHGTVTETPVTVDVELVDDPPVLETPHPISYINTEPKQGFASGSGHLIATDPEDNDITYSIDGDVEHVVTIAGVEYTHTVEGTYGTLHTNPGGDYVFVPDSAAVDAQLVPATETFTFRADALDLSDTADLVIDIDVPPTVSRAPANLQARAGNGRVIVSWDPPTWLGGSHVVDYVISYSVDDDHHWTTIDDGVGTDTSFDVRGLTNDVEHQFRVVAVNDTGPSAPATSEPVTPREPTAPEVLVPSQYPPSPSPSPTPTPTPTPSPITLPTPPEAALEPTPTGTLHRIYLTLFNRTAEPTGLNYWTDRHESGVPMRAIIVGFLESPEWQDHHGDPHGAELVHKLYLTVLGREPDDRGLAYWVGLLNDGRITETQLVLSFVDSPEMADRIRGALALG